MQEIYVGTSGWAYKAWQPEFFPAKLPQKQFLHYYATRLNAVEVNYTFRHLLSERTIVKWLEDTPEGFRFAVKAHQSITHLRRLSNAEEPLQRFPFLHTTAGGGRAAGAGAVPAAADVKGRRRAARLVPRHAAAQPEGGF